ncbi:KedN5 family methylcobalamin-dependent radical SAM C-methyltransferase [Lentzea sp. DG1S-22]|uniref:KedN5 family methylcobalamin-dependent radical SAM C-methyltransferase n=1 Tax=Lentzea sp. DG1S-22 TaxID=3108822 RepID=UPI002E7807E2|nr:KedN5 family methylcobalamin-dependent radical SAM C-methyltransferase [Lentzea sp. DG1S-22]WVH82202.1 KedN5 family methylcobalamin-dependent radical SAM C-methyltransferase [Lentzea sp. DG1S-22]
MPLASGFLKATALDDARLHGRCDIRIVNFNGGATLMKMAQEVFANDPPDVIAFSVLGWNYRDFGALAETFKQLNPDGWVIFGGTHVANQGARTFRMHPDVDVVVNGEGEMVFTDLLNAYLDGASPRNLPLITGISYQDSGGEVVTTPPRDRIDDLDVIPSPFLTGAIDLTDDDGRFKYDVALMETNRGCPYKCSFCYWGGATGQRIRAFSRERLRAELELFAKHKVHTIVLCDANFGILPIDAEFVDDMIEVRNQYGYPRALETSWAKNKSKLFFDIVRRMKEAGMRSSFTLALQTLSEDALKTMNRHNMKVNEWEDLAQWLDQEGLDCYAELIWGAPGETVESFMEGYDRLSRHVSRIAVYPLHLLPNTSYAGKKDEYGIVTVRGDRDDFEYVLSHDTMTLEDNRLVKRFLFWARVMAENAVLRHTWVGLRELADIKQSEVMRDLDAWIAATDAPAADPLRAAVLRASTDDRAYGDAVKYLLGDPSAKRLLERWWTESVRPSLATEHAEVLDAIFRYDILTQPAYHSTEAAEPAERLPVVELHGTEYFVRKDVEFEYDVPSIIEKVRLGSRDLPEPGRWKSDLYYRVGAEDFIGSTNHEEIVYFMGMTPAEVRAGSAAR